MSGILSQQQETDYCAVSYIEDYNIERNTESDKYSETGTNP